MEIDHFQFIHPVPSRWGGVDNPPTAPMTAQTPPGSGGTLGVPTWVHMLQADLRMLGIVLVKSPNGQFDLQTEWAVKEFQCYAGMAQVAKINTGRLSQYAGQAGLSQSQYGVSAPEPFVLCASFLNVPGTGCDDWGMGLNQRFPKETLINSVRQLLVSMKSMT